MYVRLAILCALGLAIIISFVLLLIDKEILGDALYSVLLEIDKALFITIVIGGVAKLISNDILAVKKNDNRLRSLVFTLLAKENLVLNKL